MVDVLIEALQTLKNANQRPSHHREVESATASYDGG